MKMVKSHVRYLIEGQNLGLILELDIELLHVVQALLAQDQVDRERLVVLNISPLQQSLQFSTIGIDCLPGAKKASFASGVWTKR